MFGRRSVRAGFTFALATFIGASASLGQASAVAAARPVTPRSLLRLAGALALPIPPLLSALDGAPAASTGSDGRLTFLLAGSDSRTTSISRTDSIMVVSLKGKTISAASIPRDIARIPNPFTAATNDYFPGKVNGILRLLRESSSSLDQALDRFEIVIERTLAIEIDYRALLWFNGFSTLVAEVDPIVVNVVREIRDPKHLDDPNGPPGVYFPQTSIYSLWANNTGSNPRCNGAYKNDAPPIDAQYWCRRALPYVRTRKGTGNNDFVRAGRQQKFVAAAIKAVGQSELAGLVGTAQAEGMGKWWTNYPISWASALELYNSLNGAQLVHQVVFKPKTYAGRISGTSSYALNLTAVRQWTAQYMS